MSSGRGRWPEKSIAVGRAAHMFVTFVVAGAVIVEGFAIRQTESDISLLRASSGPLAPTQADSPRSRIEAAEVRRQGQVRLNAEAERLALWNRCSRTGQPVNQVELGGHNRVEACGACGYPIRHFFDRDCAGPDKGSLQR